MFTRQLSRTLSVSTRSNLLAGLVLAVVTSFALATSPPGAALEVTAVPIVSVPFVSGAASSDSVGIRLTEVSAELANDPRARLYVVDRVAPGETISRTVEIANNGGGSKIVACYVSAANISDGAFLGADGATANELTSWISLSKSSLSLSPQAKSKVAVTITVPADAVAGERYGVIWAEVRSGVSDSGIVVVNRVGIRIYLSVGPGGAPASSFKIRTLTGTRAANGTPVIEALVENTGARALDISGQLTLTNGPGGLNAGPFAATLGTTLGLGQSDTVSVSLDKQIPAGPWDATLTLKSGLTEVTGSATITFPDVGRGASVPINTFPLWIIVTLIASLLLVLGSAAIFVAAQIRAKKVRKKRPRRH